MYIYTHTYRYTYLTKTGYMSTPSCEISIPHHAAS